MSSFLLSLDVKTRRYDAFTTWRYLTSPVVLGAALLGLTVAGGVIALLVLQWLPVAPVWYGIAMMGGGIGVGLLLQFFFATTYLDGASRTDHPASLTEHASFEVLLLLQRAGLTGVVQSYPARHFLWRLQVEEESFASTLQHVASSLEAAIVHSQAVELMQSTGEEVLEVEHILGALLLHEAFASWLRAHNLQDDDVRFVVWWMRANRTSAHQARQWWRSEKIRQVEGLGLSFAVGFTPLIDRLSRIPAGNLWDMVNEGREELIEQLIVTLARARQSNVLLVGQPGSGRLGIIQELARRVRLQRAHPALNGQRVIYLHVGELLARGSSSATQLAIVSQALSEIERAGNIIAVIDGVSSILAEEGEHKIDLTEVLLPFFSSLTVRVVVIISADEYHLRLKTNEELIHFFEVVSVPSSSGEATLRSLARATPWLEARYHIRIPYPAVEAIVRRTDGILQHIPYPERAFDVLEEAIVVAQTTRDRLLTPEMVEELITRKVGIPVGRLQREEKEYLLDLENRMHQRLVNQHHAISALARAMIRARAGVRTATRPIGTFLFLGPTGVGKTEAAKTLADVYFGSEKYLSRLDMSEFQTPEAVGMLIGSTTHPVGRLTSLISDTPFTVLLLDEFEKAHAAVKQLFLQVLDEGRLTDARGKLVSFQHAIIIATSNAGANLIREEVEDGNVPAGFNERLQDYMMTEGIFTPELLNRFDGIVTFTPLSNEHLKEIARGMLVKLNNRLDAEHGITVAITDELIDFLVSIGYSPQFGARPMQRAIQDTVEYTVAKYILAGQTQPGQKLLLPISRLAAERQG